MKSWHSKSLPGPPPGHPLWDPQGSCTNRPTGQRNWGSEGEDIHGWDGDWDGGDGDDGDGDVGDNGGDTDDVDGDDDIGFSSQAQEDKEKTQPNLSKIVPLQVKLKNRISHVGSVGDIAEKLDVYIYLFY